MARTWRLLLNSPIEWGKEARLVVLCAKANAWRIVKPSLLSTMKSHLTLDVDDSCVEDPGRQADANRTIDTIDTMLGRSYGNRSVHTLTDGESSKRRAAEALAAQNCVREK
jgi:hypothetical protein